MNQKNIPAELRTTNSATYLLYIIIAFIAICCTRTIAQSDENENLDKSVVMIQSANQSFDYAVPWKQKSMSRGIGSGFIIKGNKILTNAHNVSNNKYIELRKENTAKRYPAKVAFIGHDCDLAILTVNDESFFDDTIPLKLAGIPKVNTSVLTYGFPLGGSRISVTKGVVSRIQMDIYVHSGADSHLVVQTDAAINPGNSGGPVIQNGEVVGVAFQGMTRAENIGYMIPTTVIKHFLKDIEDGKYDGFGSLGISLYPGLHSNSYKDYLNIPQDQDGVVIIDTIMHSSVESIFKPNDVLTQIDNYNIDNDGMTKIHGLRLNLSEVLEAKQIGDIVELTFYRNGKPMKTSATVQLNRPIFEYARQYDQPPRYVCFAGLVFTTATRNYLETWGSDWPNTIPFILRYLFSHSMQLNTDRERKEYVVLARIMSDQANAYADAFQSLPVKTINETTIHSLNDVYKALQDQDAEFYTIRFMATDRPLILDANLARERHPVILNKYLIPNEARLEN